MNQPTPTNYTEAADVLGSRDARKIAHNTCLERLDAETIGVRLHSTYVVRFHAVGTVTLDSGGWQTVTTKERMNRYLGAGFGLYQKAHVWYVDTPAGVEEYSDGMTLAPDSATLTTNAQKD